MVQLWEGRKADHHLFGSFLGCNPLTSVTDCEAESQLSFS